MKPPRQNNSDCENFPMINNKDVNGEPPAKKRRPVDPRLHHDSPYVNRSNHPMNPPPTPSYQAIPVEPRPLHESNLVDISDEDVGTEAAPSPVIPLPPPPPSMNGPSVSSASNASKPSYTAEGTAFQRILMGVNSIGLSKSTKPPIDFKSFNLAATVLPALPLQQNINVPSSSREPVVTRNADVTSASSSNNATARVSSTFSSSNVPFSVFSRRTLPPPTSISQAPFLPSAIQSSSTIATASSPLVENISQPALLSPSLQTPSSNLSPSNNGPNSSDDVPNALLQPNYFPPPFASMTVDGANRIHYDERFYAKFYDDFKRLKPGQFNQIVIDNIRIGLKCMHYENDNVAISNRLLAQRYEELNIALQNECIGHRHDIGELEASRRRISEILEEKERLEKKSREEARKSSNRETIQQQELRNLNEKNERLLNERERLQKENESLNSNAKKHEIDTHNLNEKMRVVEEDKNAEVLKRMEAERKLQEEVKNTEKYRAKKREADKKAQQFEGEVESLNKLVEKKEEQLNKMEMDHKEMTKKMKEQETARIQAESEAIEARNRATAAEDELKKAYDDMEIRIMQVRDEIKREAAQSISAELNRRQQALRNLLSGTQRLNISLKTRNVPPQSSAVNHALSEARPSDRQRITPNQATSNSRPNSSSSGPNQPPSRSSNPVTPSPDLMQRQVFQRPPSSSFALSATPETSRFAQSEGSYGVSNMFQRTNGQLQTHVLGSINVNENVARNVNDTPRTMMPPNSSHFRGNHPVLHHTGHQMSQHALTPQQLHQYQQQRMMNPQFLMQQPPQRMMNFMPQQQIHQGLPVGQQVRGQMMRPQQQYPELANRLQNAAPYDVPQPFITTQQLQRQNYELGRAHQNINVLLSQIPANCGAQDGSQRQVYNSFTQQLRTQLCDAVTALVRLRVYNHQHPFIHWLINEIRVNDITMANNQANINAIHTAQNPILQQLPVRPQVALRVQRPRSRTSVRNTSADSHQIQLQAIPSRPPASSSANLVQMNRPHISVATSSMPQSGSQQTTASNQPQKNRPTVSFAPPSSIQSTHSENQRRANRSRTSFRQPESIAELINMGPNQRNGVVPNNHGLGVPAVTKAMYDLSPDSFKRWLRDLNT